MLRAYGKNSGRNRQILGLVLVSFGIMIIFADSKLAAWFGVVSPLVVS